MGSVTKGAGIPSPQVWPAWVKMLPCVPHSLGRSLRAGGEEPDSQALCVLPGPCADSPEAPGSLGRSRQATLTRLALEPGSSPSLAGLGWDGRADGVRAAPRSPGAGREAGPEGHVTPCQSDSARWRGAGRGGGPVPEIKAVTPLRTRPPAPRVQKQKPARSRARKAGCSARPRNEVTAGSGRGAGGAAGGPAPRDAAGLGGRAHAGLGSLPRSLPGGRAALRGSPSVTRGQMPPTARPVGTILGKTLGHPRPSPPGGPGCPGSAPRAAGGLGLRLRRARGGDPPPPTPGAAPTSRLPAASLCFDRARGVPCWPVWAAPP